MSYRAPHQSPSEPTGAPARARCACREGVGGARGAWLPLTHMRIPHRAWRARARPSLHHCMLLAVPHGVALNPPTPRHVRYEREVRAESGRAARIRPVAVTHAQRGIPRRVRPVLVRHDREPRGASVTWLTPPPQARTRHGHEAHAESGRAARTARGCRPRQRDTCTPCRLCAPLGGQSLRGRLRFLLFLLQRK